MSDDIAGDDLSGQRIPLDDKVERLAVHQVELGFYVAIPSGHVVVGFLITGQEFFTVAPCEGTKGVLGLLAGYHQYTLCLTGI